MSNQLSEFQISLKEIHYLSPKVNQGLELIFVVEGQITVETDSHFYELNELDLLVINRNELFQIKGNPDNYVLSLTISDTFIDRFYKNYRDNRFECYSKEVHMGREKMLNNLRKWLIKLIISYYRQDESHQIEFQKYLCDILLTLIRGFKKKGAPQKNWIQMISGLCKLSITWKEIMISRLRWRKWPENPICRQLIYPVILNKR